jgi:hypothetical protein
MVDNLTTLLYRMSKGIRNLIDAPLTDPVHWKRNWTEHKAFCNALYKIENDPFSKATLSFSASNAAPQDPSFLNMFTEERIQNEMQLCKLQMRRPLTDAERELLVWEPRCLAW